jgi:hypothetical protein
VLQLDEGLEGAVFWYLDGIPIAKQIVLQKKWRFVIELFSSTV